MSLQPHGSAPAPPGWLEGLALRRGGSRAPGRDKLRVDLEDHASCQPDLREGGA